MISKIRTSALGAAVLVTVIAALVATAADKESKRKVVRQRFGGYELSQEQQEHMKQSLHPQGKDSQQVTAKDVVKTEDDASSASSSGDDNHHQPRHPITNSTPPQGSKCLYHSFHNQTWKKGDPPEPIYFNSSLVPMTWDFSTQCPHAPKWDWVCCDYSQYHEMGIKDQLLAIGMAGCEACQDAVRNLFCHYTCSPYQAEFVFPTASVGQQVLSGNVQVTPFLAQRLWQSCYSASIGGIQPIKDLPSVKSLLSLIATFSPAYTLPNGSSYPIINSFQEPSHEENPNALGDNCTTTNPYYQCSCEPFGDCGVPNAPSAGRSSNFGPTNPSDQNRKTYPLPAAMIGSLHAQDFVAIILGILLVMVSAVAYLNRDSTSGFWGDESDSEKQTGDYDASAQANGVLRNGKKFDNWEAYANSITVGSAQNSARGSSAGGSSTGESMGTIKKNGGLNASDSNATSGAYGYGTNGENSSQAFISGSEYSTDMNGRLLAATTENRDENQSQ